MMTPIAHLRSSIFTRLGLLALMCPTSHAAGTALAVQNPTFDFTTGESASTTSTGWTTGTGVNTTFTPSPANNSADNQAAAPGWISIGSACFQRLPEDQWSVKPPSGGTGAMNNGATLYQDLAGALATERAYQLTCTLYPRKAGEPMPDLAAVGIELLESNGTDLTPIPSDLVFKVDARGLTRARLTAVTAASINGNTLRLRISNDTPDGSPYCQLNIDDVALSYVSLPPPPPLATAPKRYGSRPGTPFLLYLGVADAGTDRTWSANGLPAGLKLDPRSGVVSGTTPPAGNYKVDWSVRGTQDGQTVITRSHLEIVSGNTLSLTPPVGWNSWNTFENELSEGSVKEITDAILRSGLKDHGFAFVNLDDNWAAHDRTEGLLVPNPEKFPRGLNAVSDYVHSHGLKFGIYSDAAQRTCAGVQPGSFEFEPVDAVSFANWGVDYLKYDYCGAPKDKATAIKRYGEMGEMLESASRSIVYSVCEWGQREPWQWVADKGGNLWRATFDMRDEWQFAKNGNPPRDLPFVGCLDAVDLLCGLEDHQHPGAWNDPDMLTIGVDRAGSSGAGGARGLNTQQEQSEYSLWAIMGAPLIFNADLRKLDPDSPRHNPTWAANFRRIVCNPEVLAVDQDPLGKQGIVVRSEGSVTLYRKPLANGTVAIAILNRGDHRAKTNLAVSDTGLPREPAIRDLWMRRDLGTLDPSRTFHLKPFETRVILCLPAPNHP